MAKKYFWLKLKDDFFRDKRIKKLRKIAGGDTYTIIYLKLQLLSLKNNGTLIYEEIEDTLEEELALEIDEDVDNVKVTLAFLFGNGLLEETNQNHYVMTETIQCIGSESASAERVRRMRTKKRLLGEPEIDEKRYGGNGLKALERDHFKCVMCGSSENVCIHHNNGLSNELDDLITLCRKCHSNVEKNNKSVTCNTDVTKCNIEIDIEKEKELDKDKEKKKNIKEKKDVVYFENEKINKMFLEFLDIRKKIKAVNSDLAIKKLINKLNSYDDDIKIQMLENSIINSWKDVYEIKGTKKSEFKDIANKFNVDDRTPVNFVRDENLIF